ncbi:MAG: hypothetical protein AAB885_02180 [Patescibacteria group bacterium]
MRPIFLGIVFFIIGAIGWVLSVVLAVVTLGKLKILATIFGILLIISLPIGILGELVRWLMRRRKN